MFLKLRPLICSLLFLLGLEIMIFNRDYVLVVAAFLFLFSLYEGKKIGQKWRYSVLPVLYTLSSVGLLYLVGIFYEQQIFIILASSLYYLSLLGAMRLGEYEGDKTARGMNMTASAATIFFAYSGAYGIYLNFQVPLFSLMLTYLLITLLVSYQHFAIIKKETKTVWIYSFLLALTMSELIWTMNFWPFGYLTTGVIALILYYVFWDIIESHFLDVFTRRKVAANAVLFTVLVVIILLTSKWIPVI